MNAAGLLALILLLTPHPGLAQSLGLPFRTNREISREAPAEAPAEPEAAVSARPILQQSFPETEAVPGQPLTLTVLLPTYMPASPVWPSFQMPGVIVRQGRSGPTSARVGGETWSSVTRSYTIAPMAEGRFALPPQTVSVSFAAPGSIEAQQVDLETQAITLAGAVPDTARGLDPFLAATSVELEQTIEGNPGAMAPGDSAARSVTARIRGASPVMLPRLLPPTAMDGVALYPGEPSVTETLEDGAPGGTRTERVTLVAEGRGASAMPELTLAWYDIATGKIETGCETCHGPGAAHVAQTTNGAKAAPLPNGGFPVDVSDTAALMEQCAGCHSRSEAFSDASPEPGTPYHDAHNLSLLRPGSYEANGGSFLQSKMYARGVGCGNCHEPHSNRLKAEGNAVCTQCHSLAGNPDFPTLRKADYATPAHHFHEADTPGAACKSCHMTERVYMGNDWRADHSFRVPRPDVAGRTGAPDACTLCHRNVPTTRAAEQIVNWYPDSAHRGPHYGEALAAGRRDPTAASGELARLALDTERPAIVRATALWLRERSGSGQAAAKVAPLLADPDPQVRAASLGAQNLASPQDRVLRVVGLLDDPARNVRIAAAHPHRRTHRASPGSYRARHAGRDREWQAALRSRLDFPETHLQLAGMALTMRNLPAAERAFREVVTLDPQMTDAWVMCDLDLASALADIEGRSAPDLLPPLPD